MTRMSSPVRRSSRGCAKAHKEPHEAGALPEWNYRKRALTKLQLAAATGNKKQVESFLKRGVDVNERGRRNIFENGRTALMYAAEFGHSGVLKLLLSKGADPNLQDLPTGDDEGGRTALHFAAENGDTEMTEDLIRAGARVNVADAEGITPLMAAAGKAHVQVVGLLLKRGANPNLRTRRGGTALLHAVLPLGLFEKKAIGTRIVRVRLIPPSRIRRTVKLLLRSGADPDFLDRDLGTPLMNASRDGDLTIVEMLLNSGADLELVDCYGETALARAVSFPAKLRIVDYLLKMGADPDRRDRFGMSIMELAQRAALKDGKQMEKVCALLENAVKKRRRKTYPTCGPGG